MKGHSGKKDARTFWVVWSPQGGNPVVPFDRFEVARSAAWRLSEKHPGQDFFVLASCWSRAARTPREVADEAVAASCPSLEAS